MVVTFTLGSIPLPIDVAAEANKICEQASITPNQLYIKWEAWALAHNKTSEAPSMEDLHQLAVHIRESASRTPCTTPAKKKPSLPNGLFYPARPAAPCLINDDFFSYVDADAGGFPPAPGATPSPEAGEAGLDVAAEKSAPPNQPAPNEDLIMADADATQPTSDGAPDHTYAQRTGSGRIEATLNDEVHTRVEAASRGAVSITCVAELNKRDWGYMNDDIPDRIESVRAHVRELGESILARIRALREGEDVTLPTAEAFFVKSPNVVMALGRVRVELEEGDGVIAGRINPSSVVLESVDGNLVHLNLKRMSENSVPLFLNPGMVVVVEGINTSGRKIDVHAIYDNTMQVQRRKAKPPTKESHDAVDNDDDDEIMANSDGADKQPSAHVLLAAGPFTTSTNLKYEPLEDLIDVITRSSPDVVLLTGPFVDAQHEGISEKTETPFEQVFETHVLKRLKKMLMNIDKDGKKRPEIVLIPSLEDVHHDYVCPQPAFRWRESETADADIHLWANPSVLQISVKSGSYHASIGISSLPALQDISADSLVWNKEDRLGAIVSHMLRQKSFYPTFPPSSSVPLDCTFLDRLAVPDLETSPTVDVMMVPSRLKAFAKCVEGGAVAVNPGLLCRGSNGGTYAEIFVPLHLSDRPRPPMLNEERTQVSVIRL